MSAPDLRDPDGTAYVSASDAEAHVRATPPLHHRPAQRDRDARRTA